MDDGDQENLVDEDEYLAGEEEDDFGDEELVRESPSGSGEPPLPIQSSLTPENPTESRISIPESVDPTASAGQLSNAVEPEIPINLQASRSSSSKESLTQENNEGDVEDEEGDDESSLGGVSQRLLIDAQKSWFDVPLTDEENDEEEEDEEDSEEEAADLEEWRQRKKLRHFTLYKQDRLIVTYMESIAKLKNARKKNMYLQDRIYKHLKEKEKVLNQCRDAVKDRKEKAIFQQLSSLDVKRPKHDDDPEVEDCDSSLGDETKSGMTEADEPPPEPNPIDVAYEAMLAKHKKESKQRKKCERRLKAKHGKGPSKTPRLSMKHYHPDRLISKKPQPPKDNCEKSNQAPKKGSYNMESEDRKSEDKEESKKRRQSKKTSSLKTDDTDLNISLYGSMQKNRGSDVDELEDEWRYKHEQRRSREIRKSRAARKSLRKSMRPVEEDALESTDAASSRQSQKPAPDFGKYFEPEDGEKHEEKHGKRRHKKETCHEAKSRRKSAFNRKNTALQKANEFKVSMQREEDEEEPSETEEGLPEFKYELSDISLTKMKYGTKMRQELEKVVLDTKLPIHLQWPLSVKGFNDYFKRKNPYGKVIYTLRQENQVKQAKKISRKYKYVMHNYNYQLQQYKVLNEVHESNMKYLEIAKQKWEFLVEDLIARVITEVKDYSDLAVDSSGMRIPKQRIDRACTEISKEFEGFQYTARIFYRVLHNVGVAIRHLSYSEDHGEGVELFEFKHLLRANETIEAQHVQKQDTLKGYKRKATKFINFYEKQLDIKDDIEEQVTDKFRLSGEISCMMEPKQQAVKTFEGIAKKVMKKEAELRIEGGIVPYKNLVTDYENMYMRIEERRQLRRDFQLKYNSRVREVHEIFDKMDEIQRKVPELFMDDSMAPMSLDECAQPWGMSRPKTAPPSILQSRAPSNRGSAERLQSAMQTSKRPSIFFTADESRQLLESKANRPRTAGPYFSSNRLNSGTSSLRSINRKLPDPTGAVVPARKTSSLTLPPIRPNTAIPEDSSSRRKLSFRMEDASSVVDPHPSRTSIAADKRLSKESVRRPSTAGDKRLSTGGDKRLSTGGDKRLSTGGDKRLSTGGDKRLSTGGDKRPSTEGDKRRSSGGDKRLSTESNMNLLTESEMEMEIFDTDYSTEDNKRLSTGSNKRFSTGGERRPSTAGAADAKRLSVEGEKRPSTAAERRPSIYHEKIRGSMFSKLISGENEELAAAAKRKTEALMKPTAAKTGIVPKITKKNMIALSKEAHAWGKNKASSQTQPRKSGVTPMRPFPVGSSSPFESEVKHWPYQYYTKRSPQVENTSKRRMDVVLGSLVHQARQVSFG